jgi:hypothetical protein
MPALRWDFLAQARSACEADRDRLELDEAIEALRDLAHGIYPRLLAYRGLPPRMIA